MLLGTGGHDATTCCGQMTVSIVLHEAQPRARRLQSAMRSDNALSKVHSERVACLDGAPAHDAQPIGQLDRHQRW